MKLELHILSHDDEPMLEWALRHYMQIADRIVVHDGGPTPFERSPTREITKYVALSYGGKQGGHMVCLPWDTAGQLNDEIAMTLKNTCWRGTDADWVAVMDADEILHFPRGVDESLKAYERSGAVIARPHGYEMFSDEWFDPPDHPGQQITQLVTDGSPDNEWYAKPILFSARRVAESGFGVGAHESDPVLNDGRRFHCGRNWPFANPPVYLLHYKSIFGGLDRIAARYDATRARLASVNVRNGWGNFDLGMVHALAKREKLLPHVRRVIE